ncbi:MAG: rubrerythrin family protein [Blastocatellia bacterium]
MPELTESQTLEHLKKAFAREAMANRLYLYFARQADNEGNMETAGLFRDTAESKTGQAHGHLEFLGEAGDPATGQPLGDSANNLRAAIAGEALGAETLYPEYARIARAEGFTEIAEWFETLTRAERAHVERFRRGLDALLSGF